MIFLLSPAKTLKAVQTALVNSTQPKEALTAKAQTLLTELQALSRDQLKSLLKVSDSIAKLNYDRYHAWTDQEAVPAAFAFDGPAYKGLQADDLDEDGLQYLQQHLRILCGLYGVLRPLDALKPYRLEMGTKFKVGKAANLTEYWRDSIAEALNEELDQLPEEQRFVVNCASQEYFKAVDTKRLVAPVVNVAFKDNSTFRVKKARGAIVRHMCLLHATQPSELKTFTGLGGEWSFVPSQSSETEYVFAFAAAGKPAPAAKAAAASKATSGRKFAPASKAAHAGKDNTASRQATASEEKTSKARRKQPAAEQALPDKGLRGRKAARR